MEEALDKINRTTSDITEKLNNLLKTSKTELAQKKKVLSTTITNLSNSHRNIKNSELKEVKNPELRVEKMDNLKTIVIAFSNIVFINKINERRKNFDDEIEEFYKSMGNIERCYELYDDIEFFCSYLNDRRFKKVRIDFLTCFLSLNFFDLEKLNLMVQIIEKEEYKDYCTGIAAQPVKYADNTKESIIASAYKHYRDRECIRLLKSVKETIKFSLLTKSKDQPFDLIDDIKVLFMMPKAFNVIEIIDYLHNNIQLPIENPLDAIQFQDLYIATLSANLIFKGPFIKESELIEIYINSCTVRIKDWISRIQNKIITEFILRDSVPGADEDSKFISIDFINLLELIKNQLEPVAFKPSIWKKIASLIAAEIDRFGIKEVMLDELDDAVKLKSKAGYEEYVIMVANSALKVAQCIDESEWANSYDNSGLKQVFLSLMKTSNSVLSDFIVKTCSPVTTMIFVGEYNIKKLVATIEDFLSDYSARMLEYTFYDMNLILIEKIVNVYLKQMLKKNAKLDAFILENDYDSIQKCFCGFIEEDKVNRKLEVLKYVTPLISTDTVELFIVHVKALKIRYLGLNKEFCKNIIAKKKCPEAIKLEMRRRLKEVFNSSTPKKTGFLGIFV